MVKLQKRNQEIKVLPKKKKSKAKFIFSASILMILLVVIWIFYITSAPLVRKVYDVRYSVTHTGRIGFDVNPTALTFGRTTPGGSSIREVVLDNQYPFPVRVDIFISKDLLGVITSESDFILSPHEQKNVSFTLHVPYSAQEGNFTGKVILEMRKAD